MQIISNWELPDWIDVFSVKNFKHTDILYLSDTICFDELDDFLQAKGLPKYIVGDNAGIVNYPKQKIYTVPFKGLELEIVPFQKLNYSDQVVTDYAFNFCINKKQINRYLTIRLVEFFGLTSFQYTWSGIGRQFDLEGIIKEWQIIEDSNINDDLKNFLLAPIQLSSNFINYNNAELEKDPGVQNLCNVKNYGDNVGSWKNGLDRLFSRSAVSLITESASYQKSSVMTEKTIYSVLGLTFPLWVGCYGQADYFKQMGLDVFDDVIDHSYQYLPSLFERCFYSVYLNLEILQNYNLAKNLREKNIDRLCNNRKLVLQDNLLKKHTDNVLKTWPEDLQQIIVPYWNQFRKSIV